MLVLIQQRDTSSLMSSVCATLLLWSAIGCLMLARIRSFLFSIVEAVTVKKNYIVCTSVLKLKSWIRFTEKLITLNCSTDAKPATDMCNEDIS